MNQEDDSALMELQQRIGALKEQRDQAMNEMIVERRQFELMEKEMVKMKKEKSFLEKLISEKSTADKEYDRIINQSQVALNKLVENTKKLLLSLGHQAGKINEQRYSNNS